MDTSIVLKSQKPPEWVDMVRVIWEFLSKCPLPRFYCTQGNFTQDIQGDECLLRLVRKMNIHWWSNTLQFVTLYEFIFLLLSSMLVKLSPAGEVNLLTWVCIIKVLSEYQTSIVWVLADLLEYSVTVASGQSPKNIPVHITRPDQHSFIISTCLIWM